jgi:antitoxin (DNA-binding transcriptional repressor) of toxin-antitoxin stability system
MRSVGIKVLKNKLSEYIRIAASGETVLVTDRDRVVAELVPPHPDRSKMLAEARWAELIRQGIVTPAVNPHGPMPNRDPVMKLEQLLAELDEDRADR